MFPQPIDIVIMRRNTSLIVDKYLWKVH